MRCAGQWPGTQVVYDEGSCQTVVDCDQRSGCLGGLAICCWLHQSGSIDPAGFRRGSHPEDSWSLLAAAHDRVQCASLLVRRRVSLYRWMSILEDRQVSSRVRNRIPQSNSFSSISSSPHQAQRGFRTG